MAFFGCSETTLIAAGDIEGRSVWLRILEAVKELTAMKPPGRMH